MQVKAIAIGIVALMTAGSGALGQVRPAPRSANTSGWAVPRLSDGRPDLQGVWENNSATPLERPRELANTPRLTEAEVEAMRRKAGTLFGPESDAVFGDALYLALLDENRPRQLGATGTYSSNWLPDRFFEPRTSLIESPPNGRLPPTTPENARLRAARGAVPVGRPASAADLSLQDRCISYGVPDLFAAYMSLYRIVQSPDVVAIEMEKIHDVRVVPLDGRPALPASFTHYMGDARGRWQGDTLVIETANFHPAGNYMGGLFRQSDANLKLTERFTLVSPDTLRYEFTVNDPTVWTAPWTAAIYWQRARSEIYEYACHEGNYSLRGMLSGARADEAAAR